MDNIIIAVSSLINDSENLLSQVIVTPKDINEYKNKTKRIFSDILDTENDETIIDVSQRGLLFEIKRLNNPILKMIHNAFRSRDAYSFNAPFLIKHTDSDYNKRYIFWTKQTLEGIRYNIKLKENNSPDASTAHNNGYSK